MSTDIVIGQTLDLDTGQDTLDLGPNFVFNPVQKTQPLPDKGQLHLVDPAANNQAALAKDVYHSLYEEPKPDLKLENPCLRSSHIQPSNSASSSQGHLSPSQANPDIPNEDDEKEPFFKSDVTSVIIGEKKSNVSMIKHISITHKEISNFNYEYCKK